MKSKNPLFLLLVVVLTGLSIWGYTQKDFRYGLDVQGGVRLTYRMKTEDLTAEQQQDIPYRQAQIARILNGRVSGSLGVSEGSVATKGEDQFVIEIPGFTDIEAARDLLKTTGKISVYHARNVTTEKRQKLYVEAGEESVGGAPVVNFALRSNPEQVLKPGDPGYEKMIEGWDLILEGEDVKDARAQLNGKSYQPFFIFSDSGATKMENWSRRYINQGEKLAFVLDGRVLSINPVQDGQVLKDNAIINGEFSAEYVNTLTSLIREGSLPVALEELQSSTVDPTIGKAALNQIVTAGAISLGIVCLFLIVYYSFPGVVAAVAMVLYAVFTITVLKLINATFSLAAIAGLILSVGMAVDANILVFERMKEELKGGRKLLTAIDLGFRRAFTAILDSNVSTIITSAILWMFGTSIVKGFATALIIGVAISFFTALAVTRSLLVGLVSVGIGTNEKWYALNRNWFGEKLGESGKGWRIVHHYKRYFLISALLVVIGLIFIPMGGIKPNVEFRGGYEAQYLLGSQKISAGEIRENLEKAGFTGANVKFAEVDDLRSVAITLDLSNDLDTDNSASAIKIAEAAGLTDFDRDKVSLQTVGPTIRQETTTNAVKAVLLSMSFVVVYLALRFGFALGGFNTGLRFGLSAVMTMLHDVIFLIGFSALLGYLAGWEVSGLFLTAMLTVIGFSVHDTIVIFDRIRENLRRSKGEHSFEELVDASINQSVARSINTSVIAVVPLVILMFHGTPTPELKFMIAAMLAGLVVGTYSSIFNAAPILFLWDKAVMKKKGEKAGLLSIARNESKLRAAQVLGTSGGATAVDSSQYGTIKRKSQVEDVGQILDDE